MSAALIRSPRTRPFGAGLGKTLRRDLPCYLFLLPALLVYGIFTIWPMISGVFLSLYDTSGIGDNGSFIGLANYREVIADPYFWNAFWNTIAYMLGVVPIQVFLALVVAVILNNKRLKATTFYRTLFFLPVVTNTAIVGVVMGFLFSPLYGPPNLILERLGVISQGIDWLAAGQTALLAVIAIAIWKNLGIHMVYWLAALQTVPEELYEAGKVDGAGRWALFRHITVPTILPIGAIILILGLVGALKVFDLIETMTSGGPFYATEVISIYIYRFAFSSASGAVRLGYAASAAVLFAIVSVIMALGQGLVLRRLRSNQ
jgi:ABC-type sugar transport system permease subunit